MMKKLMVIGLAVLLTLSVIVMAGCGGGSANANTTTSSNNPTSTSLVPAKGQAVKLVFQTQPGTGKEFEPFSVQPVVAALDSDGNVATSFTAPITLYITTGTGGNGMISGGVTVNAVNGVATYKTVNIDGAGTGYTLTAKSSGLEDGISAPFTITK